MTGCNEWILVPYDDSYQFLKVFISWQLDRSIIIWISDGSPYQGTILKRFIGAEGSAYHQTFNPYKRSRFSYLAFVTRHVPKLYVSSAYNKLSIWISKFEISIGYNYSKEHFQLISNFEKCWKKNQNIYFRNILVITS